MTSKPVARAFRPGDEAAFQRVDEIAFGYTLKEAELDDPVVLDHSRSTVVEVDGEIVGIGSAYPISLSMPGGSWEPIAGTTWVGVLPTHRRRGVLRTWMDKHLVDAVERGESFAALWASDPAIYGRFGYGVACRVHRLVVPSQSSLDRAPRDPAISVRLTDLATARESMRAVYDDEAATRPGMASRDEAWWNRILHDPVHRRAGHSERRVLLAEDASGVRGYAVFSTKIDWTDDHAPDGLIRIREIIASDITARAELWRVLVGMDLITRVEWSEAPVDEPILLWLDDVRPVVRNLADAVHIRVLDVPRALTARRYSAPVDAVLEVRDDRFADNDGRWRLVVQEDGKAECTSTDDVADVSLDVRELGAVLLGATSLSQLAAARLVHGHDSDQVRRLTNALAHEPVAWCPHNF